MPSDVQARALISGDRILGLITWVMEGGNAELTTLDAFVEERGIGSKLLAVAEEVIRSGGGRRMVVFLSNDNVSTLAFYLHRGWRLEKVHRDAVLNLRKIKSAIPEVGRSGIPITDLWEVDKSLE